MSNRERMFIVLSILVITTILSLVTYKGFEYSADVKFQMEQNFEECRLRTTDIDWCFEKFNPVFE